MIRINLLPLKAAQKKEKLRGHLIVLAASVLLVVVGCISVYGNLLARISDEKKSISDKEAEIVQLKKTIGEVARFEKLQKDLRAKLDVLDNIKSARSGPVHLMDEISTSLPEKLWLLSYKEKGGSVAVSGIGFNEEIVAEFLRRLESSSYYKNVELKVIEQKIEGKEKLRLQKFDVHCLAEKPSPS